MATSTRWSLRDRAHSASSRAASSRYPCSRHSSSKSGESDGMVANVIKVSSASRSKSSRESRGMRARLLCARQVYGLPAVPRNVGAHAFEDVALLVKILDADHLVEIVDQGPT